MLVSFQIAGIIIIVIILSFFLAQTRITLKSGRFFLFVCGLTLFLLLLDIFSIVCGVNTDTFPKWFSDLVCKLYLIFLIIESVLGFAYVLKDIYKYQEKKIKKYYKFLFSYILISAISILIAPITQVYDAENKYFYTEGISCLVCYGFAAISIIFTIIFVLVNSKKINKNSRDSIEIWMFLWIAAAIIQFFFKYILLVSFASSVALIIIYINLENPALRLDKKTAKYNFEILNEVINELSSKKENYKLVYMMLDSTLTDEGLKNLALTTISNILSKFSDTKFTLRRNKFLTFRADLGFIIVILNAEVSDFFIEFEKGLISTNYNEKYNNVYNFKYLIINNSEIIKDYDGLRSIFYAVLEKNLIPINNDRTYIDIQTIKKIEEMKQMEKIIDYAIDNELVEVFYQPIYSKKEKRFTSAEALLRIRNKNGEIIYPGSFVEIAEMNGTIAKLGEITFKKVCKFISDNDIEKLGLEYIEVNLSVIQCGNPNLASDYIQMMEEFNVDPKFINLEITETASSNLKNIMLDNMNKLIDYGVSFSLDDFGMGNSNINYIIEMPVKIVKFDKTLVDSYFSDTKAKIVVDKIMGMIKTLNLDIVLEGIENKNILDRALDLNIDYIQGYYFSKPIMKDEFIEFIKNNNKI